MNTSFYIGNDFFLYGYLKFSSKFNESFLYPFIEAVKNAEESNSTEINIYINSGGGHCEVATTLKHWIERAKKKEGVTINTYGMYLVESSAFDIFISGSKRYCKKDTIFLLHNPNLPQNDVKNIEGIERAKKNVEFTIKMANIEYKKFKIPNLEEIIKTGQDYYIYPEEAVKYGIVDEIK